jgi:amino acid adenylation domain-containing protein/thioester reductase-like protein
MKKLQTQNSLATPIAIESQSDGEATYERQLHPLHLQTALIHHLFETHVARSPRKIALDFEGEQLTYEQLNSRANRLAHYLRTLGVRPEVLVGICVERSIEMVIGLLAILKAGGAYVPLDPTYPPERLSVILEDAQPSVLITQQRLVSSLPHHQAQIICLDTSLATIEQQPDTNPDSLCLATNLAYVIYTSGSTGKPKGVAIEHRSAVSLIDWASTVFLPEDLAGVLASTSICFDLSVFELFATLGLGGKVILAQNALYLPRLSNAEDVTLINTVPSAIAELLRTNSIPSSVRTVNLAGEPLQNRLVQQLYEIGTVQQVFNLYGPSEDTTYSTVALIEKGASEIPSIGRPIDYTQAYLLDAQLQPVADGAIGELYLGGAGLARGYLNRPDLTAERFIPNPFTPGEAEERGEIETSEWQPSKLYKTGDLARYRPDGSIEYLGRIDHQVKIRGFRIELGEIESLLWEHPDVQEAAVIARDDLPGGKQLVAYVVPTSSEHIAEQQALLMSLRNLLKQKLPDYMMPSSFVVLSALPLTSNGKINRQALPAPTRTRSNGAEFVAPKTSVEEELSRIWAEVLSLGQVGIYDHFLELGGHSLLATQIVSRIGDVFHVELPLRCLFESPTIAQLAHDIERSLQKQDTQTTLIQRLARNQTLPLSCVQEQLWFLDQFVPNHPFYNVPEALHLKGSLNIAALEQSLQTLIERHEALRTTFAVVDGQPVQVIDPDFRFQLDLVDVSQVAFSDRTADVWQLMTEEAQRPFDLAQGSLIRVTLFHLREAEYILFFNLHHIICDEWSFSVLFRELSTLYTSFSSNSAVSLPELPLQYADFAGWQRQWLQGDGFTRQLAYWKHQLRGNLPVLQLPADRPRLAHPSYEGDRQSFMLPSALTEQLKDLSCQEGTTLFMTLLAAFQTLLFRYTGQDDVLVGSPIANRHRSEIDSTIGFFVNTLVLRTDLSGSPTFRQLLSRVREVALGAYAHPDLPFESLVKELHPNRTSGQNPLFQVLFNFQNTPALRWDVPNLAMRRLQVNNQTAKFDLFLDLLETPIGLTGYFEYSTDLFDAVTMSRMVEQFQTLLDGIVTNPDQRLENFSLLTPAEQQQLMAWNSTEVEYPFNCCVHQFFEAQVERTPEAVAVIFNEQQITYQDLNDRANQLAHHLQSLGVGADGLVGLCLDRSIDLIVGVLGILKAGGAYVPLDPAYPQERLTFMVENAQATVLLTQSHLIHLLPQTSIPTLCLDTEWDKIANHSQENPIGEVSLDHLAYVIYTSGSTGNPKGVAMEHRPLANLINWQMQNSVLPAGAKTLQFSPISFDVSFQEIFSTLGAGGTLVLISEEMRRDATKLLRLLLQAEVARLFLPFVALQHLAEVAEREGIVPSSLREVITAGEQLQITRSISNWFSQLQNCTLHNHYGPSESHVVTAFTLTGSSSNWSALPPIGRPISNTQIHLLDSQLKPVPIGVPGELYIGGVSLARGYLHRPDLTQDRFIDVELSVLDQQCKDDRQPNLNSNLQPGISTRLYKTGDLARYRSDGTIEYLGRIDQQVKIRGFRIELGEIEAMLRRHPAVREAVVIAREDVPGDKHLVAYIVADSKATPSFTELRQFLQAHLPEYMVPTMFVFLEVLPLTPSGKIDRRSLPAPDFVRPDLEATLVLPQSAIEKQLAEIWAGVLHIEQVGVHDSFFELGGHSLRGAQLVARVRETFQIELTLHSFFQTPTIAGLAHLIEVAQETGFSTHDVVHPTIDLNAEAVLDPSIHPGALPLVSTESSCEPSSIFLTGATGFLGAFLLHELLQQTQAEIYCLVRAKSLEDASQRLRNNLDRYDLWSDAIGSRIIPVVGDLSSPRLGLSNEQFQILASTIDIIHHNGGLVNFVYPYSVLKAPNVLGTQEILRLACHTKVKPVHFVSTAGVFSPAAYGDVPVVREQDALDRTEGLYGYTQSKWVAEKLLMAAQERGLPTCIYRPYWIEGHSQTGVSNEADFLRSLIKGCIQLGIAPDWEMRADIVPIDYLSQALVYLSKQQPSFGKAFHLSNPRSMSWNQLVAWMQEFGYPIEHVSYQDWMAAVIDRVTPDNALHPFLAFLCEKIPEQQKTVPELYFGAKSLNLDCQNVNDGLAGTTIVCPAVDHQLLSTYFSYFIRTGFLTAPLAELCVTS